MKKIFFILLSMNVAFFLWHLAVKSTDDYHLEKNEPFLTKNDIGTIVLVSEIPSAENSRDDEFNEIAPEPNADLFANLFEGFYNPALIEPESLGALINDKVNSQKSPEIPPQVSLNDQDPQIVKGQIASTVTALETQNGGETDSDLTSPSAELTISDIVNKQLEVRPTESVEKDSSDKQMPVSEEACYRWGPIATRLEAEQWAEKLAPRISWKNLDSKTEQVQEGFLVLYPAADSFEQSNSNYEMLQSKGIDDIWLFTKGDLRGAISLGLFKSSLTTTKVLEKFKKMNIITQARPWIIEKERYYLTVRTKEYRESLLAVVENPNAMTANFELLPAKSCDR